MSAPVTASDLHYFETRWGHWLFIRKSAFSILHLQLAGPQPAFSLEHALPVLAEDLTHLDEHTHLWGG